MHQISSPSHQNPNYALSMNIPVTLLLISKMTKKSKKNKEKTERQQQEKTHEKSARGRIPGKKGKGKEKIPEQKEKEKERTHDRRERERTDTRTKRKRKRVDSRSKRSRSDIEEKRSKKSKFGTLSKSSLRSDSRKRSWFRLSQNDSFFNIPDLTQSQLYDRNIFNDKVVKKLLANLRQHEQKEHHLQFKFDSSTICDHVESVRKIRETIDDLNENLLVDRSNMR